LEDTLYKFQLAATFCARSDLPEGTKGRVQCVADYATSQWDAEY